MREEYRGYNIEIKHDEYAESPREWDNLGTMVCFHRRYNLGDKHDYSIDDLKAIIAMGDHICLPLYLYDHSGITMNTTGFSCPWDSGQVGYIIVAKDKIREEYGWKRITAKREKKICEYLEAEVKTYDMFLCGETYSYYIPYADDSCCGFYGYDSCLEEAKAVVNWHIKRERQKHFDLLKRWIKAKVPVIYRKPCPVK